MIKETKIEISELESGQFCEKLRGRVFHVTSESNFNKIKVAGEVLVNTDCVLETTFGNSENSYYRKKGCISVFDYESPTEDKWQDYKGRCLPLPRNGIFVFLFLTEDAKSNLIRWTEAKRDWISERVVPYIEAGHEGNLPLSGISEILIVKVNADEQSLAYRLQQGRSSSTKPS